MRIGSRYRVLIVVFALWLAFEPFAINVLRAGDNPDVPKAELSTEGVEGIVPIEDIMTPSEYLEYMLLLRGRSQEEAEAKAWGEWMTTIGGAYMMMDDGCADVFGFYSTMKDMSPHLMNTPYYFKAASLAASKAVLAFVFVANSVPIQSGIVLAGQAGKAVSSSAVGHAARWSAQKVSTVANWTGSQVAGTRIYQNGVGFIQRKANMMNGFKVMGNMVTSAQSTFSAKNVTTFLTHMAPPQGYKAGTGEGFYSYWRWVARKTGLEQANTYKRFAKKVGITTNPGSKVIGDAKGLGHTVGIGLCVLGIAIDSYGIVTSEDRQGGRYASYSLVKNYVGLALGSAALIAMFCLPVVGQVIGALALAWVGISSLGNVLGSYNRRWKSAYSNSYKYLYESDPEFASFYDNRSYLNPEEKAVALLVAENHYGDFLLAQTPQNEDDQAIHDKNKRVFLELEKQGVIVSYYSQKGFSLPDFSMERLQELWSMKADFMSWKPTEAEQERDANRGFWGKVGKYINPMTHISWAGDKVQSREYKKTIDRYNIEKVFFNPDYVLIKKYQNWITGNNHRGGIFDVVGLRIEQSPFNYIPLVGIDSGAYSEDLLIQAFNADAFQVGVKELMYLRQQIKNATEQAANSIKEMDKTVDQIKNVHLPHAQKVRQALEELIVAYENEPTRTDKSLFKKCSKAFGWRWSKSYGDKTPYNIINVYRPDIEQALVYDPLSIAQKAADTSLLISAIKQNLDLATMMTELGEERRQSLQDFDTEFTNYELARFLKEGSFLDVRGSTFMDWLAEIYPAYKEMEKYLNLYMDEVGEYSNVADRANSDIRSRWYWFDRQNMHPSNLLNDLNEELRKFEDLVDKYEAIKDEMNLNMPLARSASGEMRDGVFVDGGYQAAITDLAPLDLDSPVSIDYSTIVPMGD